jgi:hypothetical protein
MENLNSVCYVGRISEIRPIEGADNIELTIVNGWHAITKKGQYKVDELVIVATTDAVIPVAISDAMGVTGYLRKGQRVRTVKLRKVYSECLILSMDILAWSDDLSEGMDMMDILQIYKYEPPVKMVQLSVGGRKIKYHQNPNFKVYYKFPSQGYYDTNVWKTIADEYKIKDKLWSYVKEYFTPERLGSGIIIYGEIYGHGIQKNYDYGLKDIKFAGFDVEIDGNYRGFNTERGIFQTLDLPTVEVLYRGNWSKEEQDKYVFNNFIEGSKVPHEGVVVKCVSGERHKVAKVINPEYLIASEKHNYGDSH